MGVFWTKSPCSSPQGVMFVSLGMLVGFTPGKSCVRLPRGTAVTPLGFCSPGFREALSWCTAERMNGASSLGEDMRMGISQPGSSDPVFSSWTYLFLPHFVCKFSCAVISHPSCPKLVRSPSLLFACQTHHLVPHVQQAWRTFGRSEMNVQMLVLADLIC